MYTVLEIKFWRVDEMPVRTTDYSISKRKTMERRLRIIRRLLDEEGMTAIARAEGCSRATVWNINKDATESEIAQAKLMVRGDW